MSLLLEIQKSPIVKYRRTVLRSFHREMSHLDDESLENDVLTTVSDQPSDMGAPSELANIRDYVWHGLNPVDNPKIISLRESFKVAIVSILPKDIPLAANEITFHVTSHERGSGNLTILHCRLA
jgi:hypothetical protein